MAIADVFDSITHERPYKVALSEEETLEIMVEEGDRHFDPELLVVFIDLVRSGRVREALRDQEKARIEQLGSPPIPPAECDPFEALGIPKPPGLLPEKDQLLRKAWGDPRAN